MVEYSIACLLLPSPSVEYMPMIVAVISSVLLVSRCKYFVILACMKKVSFILLQFRIIQYTFWMM